VRKLLFMLLGLLLAVPALAGNRIVATLDEPFELDGRLFPAGAVGVRVVGSFTPTQTFNEVWVGNECLGRFLAVTAADYWGRADDALLLQRDPEGHLVLVGFALRGGETREFRFLE